MTTYNRLSTSEIIKLGEKMITLDGLNICCFSPINGDDKVMKFSWVFDHALLLSISKDNNGTCKCVQTFNKKPSYFEIDGISNKLKFNKKGICKLDKENYNTIKIFYCIMSQSKISDQ